MHADQFATGQLSHVELLDGDSQFGRVLKRGEGVLCVVATVAAMGGYQRTGSWVLVQTCDGGMHGGNRQSVGTQKMCVLLSTRPHNRAQ